MEEGNKSAVEKLEIYKNNDQRFKVIVPANVEQKIRTACVVSPKTEWSGVLFFTYKGSIEGGDLEIICKDILPMDVGTATYTEWHANEEVIAFICDNELYGCQMGLIHSHNTMATFFSGTDVGTLQAEGTDRNTVVSLIVNNEGTYNAAITRRNYVTGKVIETVNYSLFGEPEMYSFEQEYETEDCYIEYFMCDVIRKTPKKSNWFLDRICSLINKPKPVTTTTYRPTGYSSPLPPAKPAEPVKVEVKKDETKPAVTVAPAMTTSPLKPTVYKEGQMFFDDSPVYEEKAAEVDPAIEAICIQLLTGNFFAELSDINLEKYVAEEMFNKFKDRFGPETSPKSEFRAWLDQMLEYIVYSMYVPELEESSMSEKSEILASMMHDRLNALPTSNVYLNEIIKSLKQYF